MNNRVKLSLVLGLILSGCASISERKSHQYVYIQSTPPGAVILDKGGTLGATPALIRLPRKSHYHLMIERAGEERYLEIETKYSWTESFTENLIFTSLAPIGWLTDLITGAAWRYQDPNTVLFSKSAQVKLKPHRMAIAPPIASTFELSDEAASHWEKQLVKQYPETQVISLKESLPVFQEGGFDHDESSIDDQRYRHILFSLKADQVFTSEVREDKSGVQLSGELKDMSGKVLEQKSGGLTTIKSSSLSGNALEVIPSWFQFIPNSAGLEFSNSTIRLDDQLLTYEGVETGGRASLGVLTYLQAVTLSRLQIPRFDRASRWKFQFTPSARFSYKTIFFPNFSKLANVNFDFLQFGAGIGPELGYQAGKHYTYFKLIPLLTYLQMNWTQPGGRAESIATGAIDTSVEIGYLYFVNERMSIRLFSKSTSSNINLWNSVAQKVNPTTPQLSSASDSYAGIAIGYTFDLRERIVSR